MATIRRHEPLVGVLWMASAAVCYSFNILVVRHLSAVFSTHEIVFFRLIFGVVLLLPWAIRVGREGLRTGQMRIYAARAVFAYTAMYAAYYSIRMIAMADSIALQFTLPFFTLLLAIVVLGERVRAHRWIATTVGFAGALIIIRPGFAAFEPGMLVAILASALFAATDVSTRFLSGRDGIWVILFWGFVTQLPISAVPTALNWVTPRAVDAPWIALFVVTSLGAQFLITRAYSAAEASLVSPVLFIRLPFVALFGYLFYDEVTSAWTWLGAAILFAATYYGTWQDWAISRREAARST